MKFPKNKAVIGLSGGIDSAVTLVVTVKELGSENVTALLLPEEGVSSKENIDDALALARSLGVNYHLVFINPFLTADFPWKRTSTAKMNMKARIRMMILYDFANSNDAIVVGTSNKTEIMLGYGTKYGDAAADIMPLKEYYKTDVYLLAKSLGVPEKIITKKPTAELRKNQYDEEDLGISYEKADAILKDREENKALDKYNKADVNLILSLIKKSEHKRTLI